jgi:hypothetical protein
MDDLVAYKIETAKLLRYGAIIEVTSVEEALMAEAAQVSESFSHNMSKLALASYSHGYIHIHV